MLYLNANKEHNCPIEQADAVLGNGLKCSKGEDGTSKCLWLCHLVAL